MKVLIDPHTHTIMSGHAYNTIDEMTRSAANAGLANIGITEHAPKMPGSCNILYFSNYPVIRREKYGVKRLMGVEANIMDYTGRLDIKEPVINKMDIVIASFHTPCIQPADIKSHTKCLIEVMSNPFVNIIGHPDDARYCIDMEAVVLAAKEKHVLLELNNNSMRPTGPRVGAYENDVRMLELCKKHNVPVIMGSDAHVEEDIANFVNCEKVVAEVDFPDRLIANYDMDLVNTFLNKI